MMKATVYHGAHDVRLEEVADPTILDQSDAIVRVTRAAICGSDLAVNVTRPGGTVGFVGVPHIKGIPLEAWFFNHLTLRGGPAPVRAYLPELLSGLEERRIDPSPVLDLALPLSRVAEGYAAMDERRAIKVVLRS